jgi:hypothetical protein
MWLDPYLLSAWQVLTEMHGWLLVGWLGFSLLVAWVVDGDAK